MRLRAASAAAASRWVLAAAVTAGASGCGSGRAATGAYLAPADFAAAMAPLPDGGLLYGERFTGRIRRVDAEGQVGPEPVAVVDVSTGGQRGLLGLAVDQGRVFAAWTDPGERLVVGQVAPGGTRLVWEGPQTTELANGGRLAFAPDGRLVIGVGDLQQPSRTADESSVNGKLLALDPAGPPGQRPATLSSGWNNPFAFAFTPAGALWVADNAPGDRAERLTRADRRGPVTVLPKDTAPSGLAAPGPADLVVCGFASRQVLRYEVVKGRAERREVLAEDCRLGVVTLADGSVVYATERSLRIVHIDR